MTMTTDLDNLIAESQIRQLLIRYCRATDRMDRELVLTVWHDDGTCLYTDLYEGPVAGLVDVIWEGHKSLFRHSHQIANPTIMIDGDRAASETYVTAVLWTPPTEDGLTEIVTKGRYLDRWSRRNGRWGIDHRDEVSDMVTMKHIGPNEWSRAGDNSMRDRTDPSYALFGTYV